MNPLLELETLGQSVWLDYIRRHFIASGELERLIANDGLKGVTSNPAIFEKAITGSTDYDEVLVQAAGRGADPKEVYEAIAVADVRAAAALLENVYRNTGGADGFVSLEVSPFLAHDAAGTIAEARRLFAAIARPNAMIKVPATKAGVEALRTLIAEGINVNVTLLFAEEAYETVALAYLEGLEALASSGGDLARVASVASVFVSRIDHAVEAVLAGRTEPQPRAVVLAGRVAIANAKLAYEKYQTLLRTPRWQRLAAKGARPQRLLWASTGTKNPVYRDTLYVEELIGPGTVNTMPPATLDAFRDHGRAQPRLTEDVEGARATMAALGEAGVSMAEITDQLLVEGLRLFEDAFRKLLDVIGQRLAGASAAPRRLPRFYAAAPVRTAIAATLDDWQRTGKTQRLWRGDASLWTNHDESRWLGWLSITDDRCAHLADLAVLSDEARSAGADDVVLLGMGGSSLCPDVFRETFGRVEGHPALHVLDSTDPAQVAAIAGGIDPARTLVVVSSKSGSTLEPNILFKYFFDRVEAAVGREAPRRFIAITDPASGLERLAMEYGFRCVMRGVPSIGGRYSALSNFGLVPAALMGLDVARLLDRADTMAQACRACVPDSQNPGVTLGIALGTLARLGRDKVTIVASPAIAAIGAWLEQLLAESTGKRGAGLIPIDGEVVGPPVLYGDDRVFVYLRLTSGADGPQNEAIEALGQTGHAVVRIDIDDLYDLGGEFFRWEIATAVAGAVIGINPFDQPDVEASKIATRRRTEQYERTGALAVDAPFLTEGALSLHAAPDYAEALRQDAGPEISVTRCLRAHLDRLQTGDYFALLAYVARTDAHHAALQRIRHTVRDRRRVATCLGFGPRFLHSTGQAYKGGPDTGVFLQITCDDAVDLTVPGAVYTFGVVKQAQASGDFEVLVKRGRRALEVRVGRDVAAGLAALGRAVERALA